MSKTLKETLIEKINKLKYDNNIPELNKLYRLAFGKDYNIEIDVSSEDIICNNNIYKHGFGGIIDNQEKIKPCKWYDKLHPFEFEFVVNEAKEGHKIFDNMRIVSNNTPPESFHYEIIGDCFEFANDKKNAYFRQEAKKNLFRNLGSNISYDSDYKNVDISQNEKSVSFPLYYVREDTDENIEDSYLELNGVSESKDYKYLSGTELVYYEKLDEVRLLEHNKAVDITKEGRLRGNMLYLEDFWNIQMNPIIITEKNEESWNSGVPPLDVINTRLPQDVKSLQVYQNHLPDNYKLSDIDKTKWTKRREIKLKDKWIKIKIRYSGEKLVLLSAILTMYKTSFA